MFKIEKENLLLITRGEALYRDFTDLIDEDYHPDYGQVMTPNTETLKRMGKYKSIHSSGFIKIALNELLCNFERR